MNVFISIDMEGIAGIVHLQQTLRSGDDYARGRLLMIQEANAAIAGAIEGGAKRVIVNDSHADMRNLIPEEIDPRAELLIGSPKTPYGMTQGIQSAEFDVAFFVGYHAMAGTEAGILDHTYSSATIYDLRINGESWGELDLNAAIVGSYGVPVGLATGDDKLCAQAAKRIPGIKTVQVKEALGRMNAINLHPEQSRKLIKSAATEVMQNIGDLRPFVPDPPFVVEMDVANSAIADVASAVAGTTRVGRTLRYESDDIRDILRARGLWASLGGGIGPFLVR
jgi:D-amino peptidase